jgi:hypothetical protein
MNQLQDKPAPQARLRRRLPSRQATAWTVPVALLVLLTRLVSPAQEALRYSIAGQAAAEARQIHPESLPYTFKTGELRVLLTPSLGLDYNDNINTVKSAHLDDFILRPLLQVNLNYPVTRYNLLRLDLGVGYDYYFQHPEYSGLRLQSGSALSFDMYVKDFWINLHDRFQYTQDSAGQSAVAGTGRYGGLDNTAGLSTTWDLQDITLNLGYDHNNFLSSSSEFAYIDHASELVVGRAGFRFHPRLTAGLESTASFTTYDQKFLNDNKSVSGGLYADWQPGDYFHVQPRAGYTAYLFDQTSPFVRAVDQDTWYADLTVSHDITEAISYSLSAGHEIRLGIQADTVNVWYFRPSINWRIIKDTGLQTAFFYEHGKQNLGGSTGTLAETYDWYGPNLAVSHALTSRINLALNYRLTLRSSDTTSRSYTQNLISLVLTYRPQ